MVAYRIGGQHFHLHIKPPKFNFQILREKKKEKIYEFSFSCHYLDPDILFCAKDRKDESRIGA